MAVFWQHGFDAATYEALEAATGLRRQSLIYAFGDKRAMFLKALDHYAVTRVTAICDVLGEEPVAKTSVRSAFDLWLADARRRKHRGCLMVMTAGEIGPLDKIASAKIARPARSACTRSGVAATSVMRRDSTTRRGFRGRCVTTAARPRGKHPAVGPSTPAIDPQCRQARVCRAIA